MESSACGVVTARDLHVGSQRATWSEFRPSCCTCTCKFWRGGSVTTPQLELAPAVPLPDVLEPPSSIIIERVQPEIDAGRYRVKRVAGDILRISADIFKDGHDKIAAVVKYRRTCDDDWQEAEMRLVENDRWAGEVLLSDNARYVYTIEAFPDRWATWRDEVEKKFEAGQDVALELLEGRVILAEALPRTARDDCEVLETAIAAIAGQGSQAATV